jgi:hypothetical protein
MSETKKLTDSRGGQYGHPNKHFPTTQGMYKIWIERRLDAETNADSTLPKDQLLAVNHAAYMILDKLARAANNPMLADNWDDIQGYARCAKMVLGLEK